MIKITFMGAGSTVFLRNVLGDCIYTDALKGMEIALYDIDGQRLEQSAAILEAINKGNGCPASIRSYLGAENRRKALSGADFVINAIQVGGYDPCTITDFEIPKNTACARPSAIRLASAASCVHCAPSPCWRISPVIWRRYAPTHGF